MATIATDAEVKDRVEASLKTDAKMDDVKVASVNSGVVLLSGKAEDIDQSLRAIENAYTVPGRSPRVQRDPDRQQLGCIRPQRAPRASEVPFSVTGPGRSPTRRIMGASLVEVGSQANESAGHGRRRRFARAGAPDPRHAQDPGRRGGQRDGMPEGRAGDPSRRHPPGRDDAVHGRARHPASPCAPIPRPPPSP